MKSFTLVALATMATMAPTVLAADCSGEYGSANGECVAVFAPGDYDCSGSAIAEYKPTCGGNCYVLSFGSVQAGGDGTYGTSCVLYSDDNCQNEVTVIDNTREESCGQNAGNSMKCYYRC
jgi:hypothetical protein